jgi:hypothetical protein
MSNWFKSPEITFLNISFHIKTQTYKTENPKKKDCSRKKIHGRFKSKPSKTDI